MSPDIPCVGETRKFESNVSNEPPTKIPKLNEEMQIDNAKPKELQWSYHVNTRINMKIISCLDDFNDDSKLFHPEYAHIFFGDDEQLTGYNEPVITIYINAWSFKVYLNFEYNQKHKVLPAPDPIALITPYIAKNSIISDLDEFKESIGKDRKLSKPFGNPISNYELTNRNTGVSKEYNLYFHKFGTSDEEFDEEFVLFHENVQFFILLEIDGGTYIEAKDPRWEVFLLYEKQNIDGTDYQHLIGYCTAYRFYAFPDSFRLRISQFLLFPPYQKCGHGRRLLQSIYDNAISRGARDIPVEDPAPEFGRLRDMVDLMNLIEDNVFNTSQKELSKELLNQIIEKRRLWKRQIRRCFEIFRLSNTNKFNEQEYKEYRVYVKKRLVSQNREHLELFEKGDDRKAELHRMYTELETQYQQIIDKLKQQNKILN